LIRLAARTSSGTATRSSSIRPSAAAWSTTTLFVSGSRRPLAMIDSSRSTRKMMSIGVPSVASIGAFVTAARGSAGHVPADYRTARITRRLRSRAHPAANERPRLTLSR